MKIKGKLILLVVSGVLALGIASMVISINSLKKQGREEINTSRALLLEDRKEKLKNLVNIVYGVMEEALRGMHGDEAENMANAKRLIRDLRYGPEKKDYFWINDTNPIMVMHPYQSDLNGKDLSGFKDPNGKKLFIEMVNVCKEKGEGFVDYLWPKPGYENPVRHRPHLALQH